MDIEQRIAEYVERHERRLVRLVQELVRIPSENTPPRGAEAACQQYVAEFLRDLGWEVSLYLPSEVRNLEEHPLYWPGRDYAGRPNVGARMPGAGGGRSLLLSGHADTVPRGTQPWTRDPFGGELEGNRLYGRGANDMKAGLAMSLFIAESLARLGLRLRGELLIESVVDEEFGGANGTLAGRLAGFNADAAVILEPSLLRVCPAQRGGRTVHITLRAPGGVLTEDRFPGGAVAALSRLLAAVPEFAAQRRRRARVHELYSRAADPVPVAVTKVFAGGWGTSEPMTPPEVCRLELYWQAMPGETPQEVDREFFQWLEAVVQAAPDLFPSQPEVEFPIRWLPGSAIEASHPLVKELAAAAEKVLGHPPAVAGIEGPCDLFIFQQEFGIPAVLWGPIGGNTHAADEYVEIDSVVLAAKALLLFVCRWCGVVG